MSPKGLSNIPPAPSGGGKGSGDYIRFCTLRDDGEYAKIRFLSDVDEMFFEWMHPQESIVKGKRRFRGFKVCPSSAFNQACDECDEDAQSSLRFTGWVWEYSHMYVEDGDNRIPVKEGKRTLYREDTNAPRLFAYSNFHKASLEMRANKYGTLLDRDYEWIRSGEAGTNRPQYMLEPSDDGKAPMPKELAAIAAELPDLEDVVFGRVESLDGEVKDAPVSNEQLEKALEEDENELPF